MRKFCFVAVGAFHPGPRLQEIVRAPAIAPRFGVSSFRVRHGFLSSEYEAALGRPASVEIGII